MTTTLAPTPAAEAEELRQSAVRFLCGMPGLEEHTEYRLIGMDGLPVFWLECEAEPEIALPVIMAAHIAPDYTFELSDADAQALGLTHAEDALVLATLTISQQLGTATANLFAPIVVNRHTFVAKQVILEGSKHSLRHPVDSL